MTTNKHLRFWVASLLLLGGTAAVAQSPVSKGWGVGVDASRALGGHAVVQVEHAQSSEWLWHVSAGTYVGTPSGEGASWKGLKGDVLSGSVISMGSMVFPAQEHKLGAAWFLGADVTRESYRIQRESLDGQMVGASTGLLTQTREEARLIAGAQWAFGRHAAVRAHVGVGVVRDRLTSRFVGEEVNSLPMARPAGLALIWRW
ncbi:MAG: hypothetical protein O2990_05500 [Bacteroidetes bacterium]|jgi:hypothetical protein|nr:hypothetical protein [Bacteroidota bacterium]